MNKLFIAMMFALLTPACTVHVHEYSDVGYGYSPYYQPSYQPRYVGYNYATPCHRSYGWHASGGVNLNPEVNRRRGW